MNTIKEQCDHDKRFSGVFFLPKEDNGCIACGYERLSAEVDSWKEAANMMADERDVLLAENRELREAAEKVIASVGDLAIVLVVEYASASTRLPENQAESPDK